MAGSQGSSCESRSGASFLYMVSIQRSGRLGIIEIVYEDTDCTHNFTG